MQFKKNNKKEGDKMKNSFIRSFNVKHYKVRIVKKKNKFFKKLITVMSYSIFTILLLVGSALLLYFADIKIRASQGDYSPSKYNAYVVLTGSMEPTIMTNDVVVTKKKAKEDIKKNDIITFIASDPRFAGSIITHRVIEEPIIDEATRSYKFKTKGDHNNVSDEVLVNYENVIGTVILDIPKLGYIQYFLAQQGGWIFVILIPALIVLSFDIFKLIKLIIKKVKK